MICRYNSHRTIADFTTLVKIDVRFQRALSYETVVDGINSAYECCMACALQAGCEFSAYFVSPNAFCVLVGNRQQTCTGTYSLDLNLPTRYVGSNGCRNANYGLG